MQSSWWESSRAGPAAPTRPGSGEMKASVVWIDGGQLYWFQQVINPGPSILVPSDAGLDKMKERVAEIRSIQLELAKVITIEDGARRAERLKVYVRSDVFDARQVAVRELGKCGPKALTTIHEMLADPNFADERSELVNALSEAKAEPVTKQTPD